MLGALQAPDYFSHNPGDENISEDEGDLPNQVGDVDVSEGDDDFLSTPFVKRTDQIHKNAGSQRDAHLRSAAHLSTLPEDSLVSGTPRPSVSVDGWFAFKGAVNILDLYAELGRSVTSKVETVIMCCEYCPKQKLLACGLSTGAIEILGERAEDLNRPDAGLEIRETLRDLDVREESTNCVCLQWLPSGYELLACYSNGFIKVWHLSQQHKALITIDEKRGRQAAPAVQRQVLCCAVSSQHVVTGGNDGVIRVYSWSGVDKEAGTRGRKLELKHICQHTGSKETMDGHSLRVFMLRFHPTDPSHFFSGGWDDVLFKWSVHSDKPLFYVESPILCSNESLDLDGDGRMYVAAHTHGSVHVYAQTETTLSPMAILTLPQDKSTQPYVVKCFGTDKLLVGGTKMNALRLIEKRYSGTVEMPPLGSLENLPGAVNSVALGPEEGKTKRFLIAVASGSFIYLISCSKRT